jgi:hypothetical protein
MGQTAREDMDDDVPSHEFSRVLTPVVRAGVELLDAPNDDKHRQRLFRALVRLGARPLLCEGRSLDFVMDLAATSILSVADDLAREADDIPSGEA